jgi:hypothetical protein
MLVQLTAALAIVAWAAAEWLRRRGPRNAEAAARILWTAGVVLLGAHTLAAFHFVHGWSHQAAADETARQTAELIGLRWSGGVFVNYAFLAMWAADAGWWWAAPASYRNRSGRLTRSSSSSLSSCSSTVRSCSRTARCVCGALPP